MCAAQLPSYNISLSIEFYTVAALGDNHGCAADGTFDASGAEPAAIILPPTKCDTHTGKFTADGPGVLVALLDNSHSSLRSKSVRFAVTVR